GPARALGGPPGGPHLELCTAARGEEAGERLLAERGVGEDEPLAVLAPGASYGSAKRWPAESFARVGDALAAEGARVAISAAPDEAALSRPVVAAVRPPAPHPVGPPDLRATPAP